MTPPLLPEYALSRVDVVHCVDALSLLHALPDASVSLIATDPPYNGVKDVAWDNQWPSDAAYLDWLRLHLAQMRRVLKPNGSLYLFASPRMAARVELAVGEYFNVLNRITWSKPRFATKAEMFDKDTMRAYFPTTEAIVFAEQWGADSSYQGALIDENATYWQACETLKVGIIGDYLTSEFERAGVTRREIAALFPSKTGGMTGCVSNWVLGYNIPTPEQYQTMRQYLNLKASSVDYLRREYDYLRRPFNSSPYAPYTDVWTFRTVQAYEGKHECEKPLDLMRHIISMSSRPGDTVLDCFAGSGATLDAARQERRHYIGGDMSAHWVKVARNRIELPYMLPLFAQVDSAVNA